MIGYTIRHILNLAPEALPLIKEASVEEDYPVGNRAGCIASALRVQYELMVNKASVDYFQMEKVASAVEAYGVSEVVEQMSQLMLSRNAGLTKSASASAAQIPDLLVKQASFEGDLSGFKDVEALNKTAEEVLDECMALGLEPSDAVRRYAADGYLSKEAAIVAFQHRFEKTENPIFVKLAAALGTEDSLLPSGPLVRTLCKTVTGLDKEAGLLSQGFDFYKEAVIVKSAAVSALRVRVGKEEFPIEKILSIPKHTLSQYLGDDVANELGSDPMTTKAVVESLPSDLQQVLLSVLRN